jgi:SAM-dependent methyltransferase
VHNTVFDEKAAAYDKEFTDSFVGSNQRARIHQFVKKNIDTNTSLNILELNCGTGADLHFLHEYGNVLATDISAEMLKIVSTKYPNIQTQNVDLRLPLEIPQKFDLVFSNFGGFNCIDQTRLSKLDDELADRMNDGGKLVIVFMHKWSLMEFFYFLLRFNFKKAFRRLKNKSSFNGMPVYYYSQAAIKKIFSRFKLLDHQPVGILLSGEYMNGPGRYLGISDSGSEWLYPLFGADHMAYVFEIKK